MKLIRAREFFSVHPLDLHSFPAFRSRVPYWNGETYRNILHCLASRQHSLTAPISRRLRSQIVENLSACGRAAMRLRAVWLSNSHLRACDVRGGDEVVIADVLLHGCRAAYFACRRDAGARRLSAMNSILHRQRRSGANAENQSGDRAASVWQSRRDRRIVELARGRDIRVIDDAAQALGATIDGQSVRELRRRGVLSFGVEKVCFGLGGGARFHGTKSLAASSRDRVAGARFRGPCAQNLSRPSSGAVCGAGRCRSARVLSSRRAPTGPDTPPVPYRREAP